VGEPLAGAAHAALHLIDHQQPVAFVAQLAHLLQVVDAHRIDATFTLNGLKEHGDHVGVAFGGFLQRFNVVEGHPNEAFDQGPKPFCTFSLPVALKVAMLRPWKAFSYTTISGFSMPLSWPNLRASFKRRFVGFQAGAAEEHVGQPGQLDQFRGQLLLVGHMVVVATVDDLADLVLQRRHQFGVVMAQGVDGDAAESVQVGFAVDVPDAAALAMTQRNGQAAIGIHGVGRSGFDERGHGVS
jgi:hypothetical protein